MHFIPGSRSCSSPTHLMLPTLAACISVSVAGTAHAELPPLIPRDALFPKPAAMQSIPLSPDGRLISYLGRDPAGLQQLWVRQVDGDTVQKLTDVPTGVTSYEWAQSSRIVCYERQGETGQKLVALDLLTGRERAIRRHAGWRRRGPRIVPNPLPRNRLSS